MTKETEPSAVFLRHGDICVMAGASRLAYHAVPKILPPLSRCPPKAISSPKTTPSCQSSCMSAVTNPLTNQKCSCNEEGCLADAQTNQCSCSKNGCRNVCFDSSLDEINQNIIKTLKELKRTPFDSYLKSSRINVNIRQVFKQGQTFANKR